MPQLITSPLVDERRRAAASDGGVTTPFNVLDEAMDALDRDQPAYPWSVHLELGAEGTIDGDRLGRAVRIAAERHPMARARRRPARFLDRGETWEIADALDVVPVREVTVADEDGLRAERDRLGSRRVPLHESPPFRFVLVHREEGDRLLLNMHHAATDGIGAARFLVAVVRAYNAEVDPRPDLDPLDARDLSDRVRSSPVGERLRHAEALTRTTLESLEPPSRISPDGGGSRTTRPMTGGPEPECRRDGYGFRLVAVPSEVVERLDLHRHADATVNDLLLATLHQTIAEWNRAHDDQSERISVLMPVNNRPPEWWREVLGNFASFVSVSSSPSERTNARALLTAITTQTGRVKRLGTGDALLEVLDHNRVVPVGLKRLMPKLLPLMGNRMVDTAVLSNLGVVRDTYELDGAGEVTDVWFSPPARQPLNIAVGAVTYRDSWNLTFRFCRGAIGDAAADSFAALFLTTLESLG